MNYDWAQFSTGLLSDCQGRFGAMHGGIRRVVGERIAGSAATVEVAAGENGTIHRALLEVHPGAVLVIAAGGHTDRAVWGEILARAAVERKVAGVVVDGAVRDKDALRNVALPTWARGSSPAGPHKGWPGRIGIPIACAGVVVTPGDVVVADGDGVVVLPAAAEERLWKAAVERRAEEQRWIERISAGETTASILGLPSEEP